MSIYVKVANLGGITLNALVEDLKFSFSNFRRFEKKAVVSEYCWFDQLAAVGAKVFHRQAGKHFGVDEKEAAIAWVSEPSSVITT